MEEEEGGGGGWGNPLPLLLQRLELAHKNF